MNIYQPEQAPAKWPFPPRQGRAKKPSRAKNAGLTRGAMLADVCLVAVWGASIPGLLWLGTWGGF